MKIYVCVRVYVCVCVCICVFALIKFSAACEQIFLPYANQNYRLRTVHEHGNLQMLYVETRM